MKWEATETNCVKNQSTTNWIVYRSVNSGLNIEVRFSDYVDVVTNNFDRDIAPCHFVGDMPTIVSDKAKFYCRDTVYEGWIDECHVTCYEWHEVEREYAGYFSMVLDHGEWSFFPSWEETYEFLNKEEPDEENYKLKPIPQLGYGGPIVYDLDRKLRDEQDRYKV